MKSFALSVFCCAGIAAGQLVAYPNGAVAPFDPNNAAATQDHFEALAEAGSIVNPYNTHAQNLLVAAPVYYGKRSADAQLVTYANGAVAPYDHNVAVATANHFAAKGLLGGYPLVGAAGVHPAYAYAGAYLPYAAVADGLVHLPNGAVVPVEPEENQKARADHLAAKLALGRKKREADPAVVYAAGGLYGYGYA